MVYYYNNELYHHGVKGMKWGVRHERKKSPRKKSSKDENDSKKRKGLSDKQKRAIKIGASAAAAGLLIYGGYRLHKSGKINKNILRGKEIVDKSVGGSANGIESVNGESNWMKINPKRLTGDPAYQYNCGNCCVAAEVDRRGHKGVTAIGNTRGMTFHQVLSCFNGATEDSITNIDLRKTVAQFDKNVSDKQKRGDFVRNSISAQLAEKHPEGSRGFAMFPHLDGQHWIKWERTKNSIIYSDDQYSINLNDLFGNYDTDTKNVIRCIRVDNLGLNDFAVSDTISGYKNIQNTNLYDYTVDRGSNFVLKK